jgi:Ni/Co efflux regulator RcnB
MRKIFVLALIAATAAPAIATAQTGELRRDRAEIRHQQQDLRHAQVRGDRRDVREQRRDVRDARREYREDWQKYRRDNRNVFRQRPYVGPRGYRYRVLTPGYRLAPAYFGTRYVIADPYRYRLPRVTGRQRWVRYGNDVVLVDTRNGRVIRVYRDFFW